MKILSPKTDNTENDQDQNQGDNNNEDKTLYLKDSINEIKKNKSNEVNIFLTKNKINNQ